MNCKQIPSGQAMSVSSNIPLLSDPHIESSVEAVPDSPSGELGEVAPGRLKMATPAGPEEDIKLQEVAAEAGEMRQGRPSLESQKSTVSQAANVKGPSKIYIH